MSSIHGALSLLNKDNNKTLSKDSLALATFIRTLEHTFFDARRRPCIPTTLMLKSFTSEDINDMSSLKIPIKREVDLLSQITVSFQSDTPINSVEIFNRIQIKFGHSSGQNSNLIYDISPQTTISYSYICEGKDLISDNYIYTFKLPFDRMIPLVSSLPETLLKMKITKINENVTGINIYISGYFVDSHERTLIARRLRFIPHEVVNRCHNFFRYKLLLSTQSYYFSHNFKSEKCGEFDISFGNKNIYEIMVIAYNETTNSYIPVIKVDLINGENSVLQIPYFPPYKINTEMSPLTCGLKWNSGGYPVAFGKDKYKMQITLSDPPKEGEKVKIFVFGKEATMVTVLGGPLEDVRLE